MTPGVPTFVAACQEIGINICHDINSGDPVSVGLAQTNTHNGIRSYATNAYLSDDFRTQYKNLVIRTNHVVRQLVLDGRKIHGVVESQSDSDKEIQFLCNHKVILYGSTIASSHELLLQNNLSYRIVKLRQSTRVC